VSREFDEIFARIRERRMPYRRPRAGQRDQINTWDDGPRRLRPGIVDAGTTADAPRRTFSGPELLLTKTGPPRSAAGRSSGCRSTSWALPGSRALLASLVTVVAKSGWLRQIHRFFPELVDEAHPRDASERQSAARGLHWQHTKRSKAIT
jgi:hypothetical protein